MKDVAVNFLNTKYSVKGRIISLSLLLIGFSGVFGYSAYLLNPAKYTASVLYKTGLYLGVDAAAVNELKFINDLLVMSMYLTTKDNASKFAEAINDPSQAKNFTGIFYGGRGYVSFKEFPKWPYVKISVRSSSEDNAITVANLVATNALDYDNKILSDWTTPFKEKLTKKKFLLDEHHKFISEIENKISESKELFRKLDQQASNDQSNNNSANNESANLIKPHIIRSIYELETRLVESESYFSRNSVKSDIINLEQNLMLQDIVASKIILPAKIENTIYGDATAMISIGLFVGLILSIGILFLNTKIEETS